MIDFLVVTLAVLAGLWLDRWLHAAYRRHRARREAGQTKPLPETASRPLRLAAVNDHPTIRTAKVSRYQSTNDPYFENLDED